MMKYPLRNCERSNCNAKSTRHCVRVGSLMKWSWAPDGRWLHLYTSGVGKEGQPQKTRLLGLDRATSKKHRCLTGLGLHRKSRGRRSGRFESCAAGGDLTTRGDLQEAKMTHGTIRWWTSLNRTVRSTRRAGQSLALAVLGAIVAVWLFGI
jgi:hypothetical protein